MTLEWSDFKVLLALSRAGSGGGGAREVQGGPSTVSRRLTALEEAVGARLLIRSGREFAWTCEGRAMLEAAVATEAATATALRAVRASKVDVQGSVRVSVAPAFVHILMQRMIPALREAHPMLHVELGGAFQRADLARGDADIAVRMARPEEPDLVARRGFDCSWFVYAAAAYLEVCGRPVTFAELAGHDLVLYAASLQQALPTRWLDEAATRSKQPHISPVRWTFTRSILTRASQPLNEDLSSWRTCPSSRTSRSLSSDSTSRT